MLLDRGADINAWGGDNLGYPLHNVCSRGGSILDLFMLFLEKGASVHALGGTSGSTLDAAACTTDNPLTVMRLLLDQGVDVNAQGGRYANVLQAACAN